MRQSVQARLDEDSCRHLSRLTKQLGWSPSRVVREGLQLLAACRLGNGRRQIIGQAKFKSNIPDLASNKKHLRGFGK